MSDIELLFRLASSLVGAVLGTAVLATVVLVPMRRMGHTATTSVAVSVLVLFLLMLLISVPQMIREPVIEVPVAIGWFTVISIFMAIATGRWPAERDIEEGRFAIGSRADSGALPDFAARFPRKTALPVLVSLMLAGLLFFTFMIGPWGSQAVLFWIAVVFPFSIIGYRAGISVQWLLAPYASLLLNFAIGAGMFPPLNPTKVAHTWILTIVTLGGMVLPILRLVFWPWPLENSRSWFLWQRHREQQALQSDSNAGGLCTVDIVPASL